MVLQQYRLPSLPLAPEKKGEASFSLEPLEPDVQLEDFALPKPAAPKKRPKKGRLHESDAGENPESLLGRTTSLGERKKRIEEALGKTITAEQDQRRNLHMPLKNRQVEMLFILAPILNHGKMRIQMKWLK